MLEKILRLSGSQFSAALGKILRIWHLGFSDFDFFINPNPFKLREIVDKFGVDKIGLDLTFRRLKHFQSRFLFPGSSLNRIRTPILKAAFSIWAKSEFIFE